MTLLEALCRPLLPVCLASRKPWRAIALPSIVFRCLVELVYFVMQKQEKNGAAAIVETSADSSSSISSSTSTTKTTLSC
jgi:hypothetical protein